MKNLAVSVLQLFKNSIKNTKKNSQENHTHHSFYSSNAHKVSIPMIPKCYGWHYPTSEWLQDFYTPQVSLLLKIYFLVQNERHFVTQKKLQRMLNSKEKLTSIFAKFFQFKSSGRSYVFLVVFSLACCLMIFYALV